MEASFMTLGVFSAFSLVEWLIVGFIGANMAIAGACLLQHGFKRIDAPDGK